MPAGPASPTPRVLVVAPLYHTDRGGLGRQAVLLTERLAELGARMLVATREMTGLPPREFSPRVEVIQIPAGRKEVHNYERPSPTNLLTSLRFTAGLARLIEKRRDDFELIHFHGASLPLLGALPGASWRGKKVVAKVAAVHQGVEAGDLSGHYGPLGPVMARSLKRVSAFVATTAEIEQELLGEGYAQDTIVRIPNFVDVARFRLPSPNERQAAKEKLGFAGRTVVLHSGRLSARKAGDVLLQAFAQARPRAEATAPLLVFLGDGPQRASWEELSRSLGVQDDVRFVGFREDVWTYLAAADVFALSSLIEGLPNALLEAMSVGLPTVATRLGGSLEALQDGVQGLLVPPGEAAPLAAGLERLLLEPGTRERLGQAAAARIRASFTLDATAPRYLELYRRLLSS